MVSSNPLEAHVTRIDDAIRLLRAHDQPSETELTVAAALEELDARLPKPKRDEPADAPQPTPTPSSPTASDDAAELFKWWPDLTPSGPKSPGLTPAHTLHNWTNLNPERLRVIEGDVVLTGGADLTDVHVKGSITVAGGRSKLTNVVVTPPAGHRWGIRVQNGSVKITDVAAIGPHCTLDALWFSDTCAKNQDVSGFLAAGWADSLKIEGGGGYVGSLFTCWLNQTATSHNDGVQIGDVDAPWLFEECAFRGYRKDGHRTSGQAVWMAPYGRWAKGDPRSVEDVTFRACHIEGATTSIGSFQPNRNVRMEECVVCDPLHIVHPRADAADMATITHWDVHLWDPEDESLSSTQKPGGGPARYES